VRVPAVVGQDLARATGAVERAGFEVRTQFRTDLQPQGQVIEQRPAAGREAEEGSTVTLFVSSGPVRRTVPSVAGQSERSAVRELTRAGFRVETEERPSGDVPRGRAIGTRPAAGTEVDAGSRVRLLISSGPRRLEVPGVVGLTRNSAEAVLDRAGFAVRAERARSDAPEDEVIAQSPDEGVTATEGSTVTIAVSTGPADEARDRRPRSDRPSGPETATVPDVLGLSAGTASARLRAAGFAVSRVTEEVGNRAEDGEVLDQSPGAGAERREGSVVTIVVGRFVDRGSRPGAGGDGNIVAP
jgi:eukaryotic-like serine/threonine-protein kinase